jgi:hypothetical protein
MGTVLLPPPEPVLERGSAFFVQSRHLTKGQQAMALAMIYPEGVKGGRGKKRNSSETEGFSAARLSQARTVLRFSEEVADSVFAGVTRAR